jgi:tol-pal system protein YbgF
MFLKALPMTWLTSRALSAVALGLCLMSHPARAGLFDDDEARKAILDLRQKLEQSNEVQRTRQAELNSQLMEQIAQIKRSLLDLNSQLEMLRSDNAKLRGQNETLSRDVADLQRKQKDVLQGVDERVRKLEPQKVTVDGKEFLADAEEKRLYEDAMAPLRKGEFAAAASALSAFARRYPGSGYNDSVLFWLGNAQYGKREFKEAITSFRSMVTNSPDHPRAAEALLSVVNCQIELKDNKAAKRTVDELVKAYPASEAAQAGKERAILLK